MPVLPVDWDLARRLCHIRCERKSTEAWCVPLPVNPLGICRDGRSFLTPDTDPGVHTDSVCPVEQETRVPTQYLMVFLFVAHRAMLQQVQGTLSALLPQNT